MKSQMVFLQMLLTDVDNRCHTSTHRDHKTIAKRFEHEGMSFLTITLPNYANDFQQALDRGQVDPSLFAGFQRQGQLPVLLGGLLDQVFDRGGGRLLDDPSITAIQAVRQITMAFGKIELDCSYERVQTAYQEYIKCESDIRRGDRARSSMDLMDYRRVAHLLWRSLNSRLDRKIYNGELTPAHGPGATADSLKGNRKFTLKEWTERLEGVFPFIEWGVPVYSVYDWVNEHVDFREPGTERPVKVIHVPKTLKTPRIIAEEPTCMMFMQQAILAEMQEEFRVDNNARNLICFDSQIPNQVLAREGSANGRLATLDLKEASDRVSNQLVRELFANFPHIGEAVQVVRSRKADVQGKVIRLAKYASMGSALTFPLEAMVFCTLVFLGIEKELNRPLTQTDIKNLYGQVRVYGDDIIVPVQFVSSVIHVLEHFGAKVNLRKSFWNGKFRESCGGDYYAGMSVDIARVRKVFPKSLKDGEEIESIVALRNQLFELGYEHTVDWLDARIQRILLYYPIVTRDSGVLGKWSHGDVYDVTHWDGKEQRPLVKGYVSVPRIPSNSIDGYPALLKVFLKRAQTPFEDPKHLIHSGRPSVVDIKLMQVRAGGFSGYGAETDWR
jgi:hypothetical protein